MRSNSIKNRALPPSSSKGDLQKFSDYLDSRSLINKISGDSSGKTHNQPFVFTPSSSRERIKGPAIKASPAKSEKVVEKTKFIVKSPHRSPYTTISNEKSPSKLSPGRVEINETSETREINRLNELLVNCQKELQMTRNNYVENQSKLEKIIKDQKHCISELEMENLKAIKDLANMKSMSKKDIENVCEREGKALSESQKKAKDYEEQTKFYMQENVKIKQQYEKDVQNLRNLLKEQEGKLEVYKREFTSFHTKVKKDQDDIGFKDEYLKKLQEGVKEKTKQVFELKQNNDQFLKLLEEKEQRISDLEKEIKNNTKMCKERASETTGEKPRTKASKPKGRKTDPIDKKSSSSTRSPIFNPAPEMYIKDFELSLETSLKNARISEIALKDDSSVKLKSQILELEQKLSLITAENDYLKKENESQLEKFKTIESEMKNLKSPSRNQSKTKSGFKIQPEIEDRWVYSNQIAELSEVLEKTKKRNTELQAINTDIISKFDSLQKDNEKLQKFYQNLVIELEEKKKAYNQTDKVKEKEKSVVIKELKIKVTERNRIIESLQELLTKERENFQRKWLDQEQIHAAEIQNMISFPNRKTEKTEEFSYDIDGESIKNIDELIAKNKELIETIDKIERKSLEKDQENLTTLLKKSNEISDLSVEKSNLIKKNIELNKKLEEIKTENSNLITQLIESQETLTSLKSEKNQTCKHIEENNSANSKTLENELQNKDSVIKKLQFNLRSLENTIKSYQETLRNKDSQIEQLNIVRMKIEEELRLKNKDSDECRENKDNGKNEIKKVMERKDLEISTLRAQVFLLEGKIKDILDEGKKVVRGKSPINIEDGYIQGDKNVGNIEVSPSGVWKNEDLVLKLKENERIIEELQKKETVELIIEYKNVKLVDDTQKYEETIRKLEQQIDTLNNKLKYTEGQIELLNLDSSLLSANLDKIQKYEEFIESLKTQNLSLTHKLSQMESKPEEILINIEYYPLSSLNIKTYEDKDNNFLNIIDKLDNQVRLLQNYKDSVNNIENISITIEYIPLSSTSTFKPFEEELESQFLEVERQYKGEIQYLKKNIENINHEIISIKDENLALIEKLKELEDDNAKLKCEKSEYSKLLEEMNMESIEASNIDNESMQNDLISKDQEINRLESELKQVSKQLSTLQELLFRKNSELSALSSDLSVSEAKFSTLSEDYNKKLSQSKEDFYILKDKYTDAENLNKNFESKLKLADIQKSQLKKSIKDLEEDIKGLREENYILLRQLEDSKTEENAIIISDSSDSDKENVEEGLKQKVFMLEEEIKVLKERENIEIHVDYVPDEILEKNYKLADSQKSLLAAIQSLEEKNKQINKVLYDKNQENKEMTKRVCELHKFIEEINDENKQMREENRELIRVNREIQDKIIKLESENTEINNYVDELNMDSIENSLNEDKGRENDIKSLQNELRDKETQAKNLENLLNETRKEANDIEKSLRENIGKLENEVAVMKLKIDEEKQKFKELIETSEHQLSQTKSEFFTIKEQLKKIDLEVKSKEGKIKYLELQREKMQRDVKETNLELQELKEENYSLLMKIDNMEKSKDIEELDIVITYKKQSLEEEIAKYEKTESKLMQIIKDLEIRLKDSEKEVSSLEAQLQIYIECDYVENRQSEDFQRLKDIEIELRGKIIELEEQIESQTRVSQQKAQDKDKEIKQLQQEKRIIGKKNEDLSKELMVIKDENVNLIRNNEELGEINEALNKELVELSKVLDETNNQNIERDDFLSEDLKSELENKFRITENELQGQIDSKNQQITDLQNAIIRKSQENDELVEKLTQKNKEVIEKNKEIKENMNDYEKKNFDIKQEIIQVKEKLRENEQKYKEKEMEKKTADIIKAKLQKEINDLEDDLKILREENFALMNKNNQDTSANSISDIQELGLVIEYKANDEDIKVLKKNEAFYIEKISLIERERVLDKEESDKETKKLIEEYERLKQETCQSINHLQNLLSKEQETSRQAKHKQETQSKDLIIIKEENINLIKTKDHLEDENQKLKKTIESLQNDSKLSNCQNEFETSQSILLQTQLSKKSQELETLNQKLNNYLTEAACKNAELQQLRIEKFLSLQDLTQKCVKYESDLKEKDSKLQFLELQKTQLQNQLKNNELEYQTLKEENFLLTKQNQVKFSSPTSSKSSSQEDGKTDNNENLTESVEKDNRFIEKIEELQKKNQENDEIVNSLLQEKIGLSNKIYKLEEMINEAEREKESLLGSVKELSKNVEFLRKLNESSKDSFEKQINKLKKDLEFVRKQAKIKSDEDNVEKIHIREENVKLVTQYEKLEEELEGVKQEQNDYQIIISKLETKNKAFKEKIKDLLIQLHNIKT
ncbi:hypothetical protein SteCoe_26373 [Stentor coeruleus]|uniref:Uncharacterized protein n=1 Tax=Stentor coeruleus TaxID=5963 RepID=A0A1R2BD01_9CILI|nr:hypothetical protein SteCoe_26373 [Stentor coeruleus]